MIISILCWVAAAVMVGGILERIANNATTVLNFVLNAFISTALVLAAISLWRTS